MTVTTDTARHSWQQYAWIAITLAVFVPFQIGALFAADRLTRAIGVGDPEREHFAFIAILLGGLLMVVVTPITARLLALRVPTWAGWPYAAPILLAAVAAYVFFEDVRSGFAFETDHALPEILIPYAVVLLASAAIGHHLVSAGPARRAWAWVVWAAAAMTVLLIGLTAAKMATSGGDFALDSPLTALALAVVGAYAVVAAARVR